MFVKQIDKKTALQLAEKGKEVLVMIPGDKDPDWNDMMPDTLQHMLAGCLFFRKEPAMEVNLVGEEPQQEVSGENDRSPDPAPAGKRKKIDTGKLRALHKAGWPVAKIAEELRVSERAVYSHLQKMKGENRCEEN